MTYSVQFLKEFLFTGDFNTNMMDNSGNGKKFKDLLQLAGFNKFKFKFKFIFIHTIQLQYNNSKG